VERRSCTRKLPRTLPTVLTPDESEHSFAALGSTALSTVLMLAHGSPDYHLVSQCVRPCRRIVAIVFVMCSSREHRASSVSGELRASATAITLVHLCAARQMGARERVRTCCIGCEPLSVAGRPLPDTK
jgi:hypothetical protein